MISKEANDKGMGVLLILLLLIKSSASVIHMLSGFKIINKQ
jgi:hypothetical protein